MAEGELQAPAEAHELTPAQKDRYRYMTDVGERIKYEAWQEAEGRPVRLQGDGTYLGHLTAQHDWYIWRNAARASKPQPKHTAKPFAWTYEIHAERGDERAQWHREFMPAEYGDPNTDWPDKSSIRNIRPLYLEAQAPAPGPCISAQPYAQRPKRPDDFCPDNACKAVGQCARAPSAVPAPEAPSGMIEAIRKAVALADKSDKLDRERLLGKAVAPFVAKLLATQSSAVGDAT